MSAGEPALILSHGQAAQMDIAPDPKSSQIWKGLFRAGVVWGEANLLLTCGFRAVEDTNVRFSKQAECIEHPCAHLKKKKKPTTRPPGLLVPGENRN